MFCEEAANRGEDYLTVDLSAVPSYDTEDRGLLHGAVLPVC